MIMLANERCLDLSTPKIMGILNVTPDSFYDGGRDYLSGKLRLDSALRRAEALVAEGAHILDIGGESTRPGAAPVPLALECDRVLPVLEAVRDRLDVFVSVDTSSPELIRAAGGLGAHLINDVRALMREGAMSAVAESGMAVCLMHMQGGPATMQSQPEYADAVADVFAFLRDRKIACLAAGIAEGKILVDPGIGFGKRDEHNLALIKHLRLFTQLGPVLLGVSRKSMFGRLLGRDVSERLAGSLAVAAMAMPRGVSVLRVHDVAATRDLLTMFELVEQSDDCRQRRE